MGNLHENLRSVTEAINSSCATHKPNEIITLYEGKIQVQQPNRTPFIEQGSIYASWLPSPHIGFEIWHIAGNIHPNEDVRLNIPSINLSGDAFIRNIAFGNTHTCMGSFPTSVHIGKVAASDNIIFHVTNFSDFTGTLIRNSEATSTWRGRLALQSSNYDLVIDEVKGGGNLIKSLKREGGFAITHVGKLARTDKQPITPEIAQQGLKHIGYFLSFLNGMWSHPILPTGYTNGNKLWQEWGTLNLTPWRSVRKWFPSQSPDELLDIGEAFYGFMERCEDANWEDPILSAIHWYVEANITAGGVEGATILASTALELLGWVHLVVDKKLLTPAQFNRTPAAINLRALLQNMSIPVQIPQELSNLHQLGASDGPDAFVELRNRIVHPPSKSGQNLITNYPLSVRQEARNLGLWYLELVLLSLFSYKGFYYQRFRSGFPYEVIEKVPWV